MPHLCRQSERLVGFDASLAARQDCAAVAVVTGSPQTTRHKHVGLWSFVGEDIGEHGRVRSISPVFHAPPTDHPCLIGGNSQRVGARLAARRRLAGGFEERSGFSPPSLVGDAGDDLSRRIDNLQHSVEVRRRDAQPDLLSRGEARPAGVRPPPRLVESIVQSEPSTPRRPVPAANGGGRPGMVGGRGGGPVLKAPDRRKRQAGSWRHHEVESSTVWLDSRATVFAKVWKWIVSPARAQCPVAGCHRLVGSWLGASWIDRLGG